MAAWRKRQASLKAKEAKALGPQTAAQGFKPFVTPTQAPVGSYDPAYDAQLENAQTGYLWSADDRERARERLFSDYGTADDRLQGQYNTAVGRQSEDYGLAKQYMGEDYNQGKSQLAQDYGTSKGYLDQDRASSLGDLLTAKNRGQEDYGQAVKDLDRSYGRLGDSQRQNANAAGVGGGGALAQAMMKRKENQAYDQSGIDRSNSRFMQDNQTQTDRTNQGFDRQGASLQQGFDRGNQSLDQGFQRGTTQLDQQNTRGLADMLTGRNQSAEDLDTNFLRTGYDANLAGKREFLQNETFKKQINQQTLGIAAANGSLPTAPENEHTYKGITYRNETHNGKTYRRLPNGRLVPTTQKLASATNG